MVIVVKIKKKFGYLKNPIMQVFNLLFAHKNIIYMDVNKIN